MRRPARRGWVRRFAPFGWGWLVLAGCVDPSDPPPVITADAGAALPDAGPPPVIDEEGQGPAGAPSDQPLVGLARAELDRFRAGDKLFDKTFAVGEGLGPLYIRAACSACHRQAGSGPGDVEKFQIVDAVSGAPIPDAPELMFGHTERPFAVAGATRPLLAPAPLAGHALVQSRRVGPTVTGRGYLEAVLDSEIERVAAEQALRTDGIHGRINRVTYHSQPMAGVALAHSYQEPNLIGRFGWKARVATLDDFAADAFQGDMGLTSPMRPDELSNPDGLRDDDKAGLDLNAETVTTVAHYVRTLEIPARTGAVSADGGAAAFAAADCAVCHVPTLRTRPDFPVVQLADSLAPLYSDLLLHDMGEALADRQTDETAGPRDWRTTPLIGLRFQSAYLHDGRAGSVEAAILEHAGAGSEANGAVEKFKALSRSDREALLGFVQGL
jgi:CxxC motif-containing protein (DUF1111 family)